ncbi:hypothetical protein Nepgr_029558 [Nepenthes gracilis]|uniref:Uncharacterized protein n=1 Tax=Nepenthes gracilis TaxID=150966 RepID=A0AAD3TDT6_NEPGR|nr:hypothetical protein Nepgr_029558 [Nepenthes gracilis]
MSPNWPLDNTWSRVYPAYTDSLSWRDTFIAKLGLKLIIKYSKARKRGNISGGVEVVEEDSPEDTPAASPIDNEDSLENEIEEATTRVEVWHLDHCCSEVLIPSVS